MDDHKAIKQGKPRVYKTAVECIPHNGARTLSKLVLMGCESSYGEESAEAGSSGVIVYGHDRLLMHPVAPPSPDYVPGPEHPPSLDYVPGPEHPPLPIEIPYVPMLDYPKYLVPSDAEAPLEDQALHDDASPITIDKVMDKTKRDKIQAKPDKTKHETESVEKSTVKSQQKVKLDKIEAKETKKSKENKKRD
nr:hypothetical protein [Tanacetum cinerariifolium]